MARAEQIKALIRSHAEGDDQRFYAIAMQVAAQAARGGRGNVAQEIRALIDEVRERNHVLEGHRGGPVPLARPRGELAGLLTASYPRTLLTDMELSPELRERLERVLLEQRRRDRLLSHGFAPLRKLLLVGPPGTGKTMTASALAGELSLPLLTIRLEALITRFMGETAAKLRVVFDAIEKSRGVYLFDEFDALGGKRDAGNDVGEIRRVLNSFLQFLEQDESDSLVVAATNHPGLLDDALFRRFDAVLSYAPPTRDSALELVRARLAVLDTGTVDWSAIGEALDGLSHGEIARACDQAAKSVLLGDGVALDTGALLQAIAERRRTHS